MCLACTLSSASRQALACHVMGPYLVFNVKIGSSLSYHPAGLTTGVVVKYSAIEIETPHCCKPFCPHSCASVGQRALLFVMRAPLPVRQVPAYFSEAQREATMAAGRLAGLEVVRLIRRDNQASRTSAVIYAWLCNTGSA